MIAGRQIGTTSLALPEQRCLRALHLHARAAAGLGRIRTANRAEMLRTVGRSPMRRPRIFVCGPTAFVEQAADLLVHLGHEPAAARTERFGPTG